MKERYNELDLMKGIGIILVYLGHSFNLKGLVGNSIYSYLWNIIYSFHMPLFFLISGFLMNNGKEIQLKKYYIHKIKRILIPYFFINLIDFFPRTLFPNLVNSKFDIMRVFFYGTKITWFIYTLFMIFIIFPFLEKYILKKDRYYLFGIILILVNYFKVFHKIEIFSINIVVGYLLYFYIGYIIRTIYKNKIINGIWNKNIVFLIFGVIFLVFSYKSFYLNYFNSIIFALMGILLTLNISLRIKEENSIYDILKFIGINSLTFYLIEGFITVVYRTILYKIIPIEQGEIFVSIFFVLRILTAFIAVKMITKSSILSFLLGAEKENKLC